MLYYIQVHGIIGQCLSRKRQLRGKNERGKRRMVQSELHIRGSIFSTIAKMLVYFTVALFFFSLYTSNPRLVILRKTVLR